MYKYVVRKERSGYFLYDIENNSIYYSDLNNEDPFCALNYKKLSRNECVHLGQEHIDKKTINFIDNSIYNNIFSAPETVFLEVTKKCNLKCNHCFNDSGTQAKRELTLDEIKNLIDEFSQIGIFTVKVTGGEPFCREDIISILEYLNEKSINFILFSNGINIPNKYIEKLKAFNRLLKIRISIDGNKESNDLIRGNGSFNKAMNTIKTLCEHNIPCEVNYTITKTNYMQIKDVAKHLNDNNISCKINIGMVKIAGRANSKTEEYYFNCDNIIEASEHIREQILENDNIKPYYLLEPIYYKLFGNSFGCPAARLTTTIKSTGEVYPCGLLSENSTFSCGNIKDFKLIDIWNNPHMNSMRFLCETEKCQNCQFYLKTCTGACRGNALNYNGDILSEDINCYVYQIDFNN